MSSFPFPSTFNFAWACGNKDSQRPCYQWTAANFVVVNHTAPLLALAHVNILAGDAFDVLRPLPLVQGAPPWREPSTHHAYQHTMTYA